MNKTINNSTRLSQEEFISISKRIIQMIQKYYTELFGCSTVSSGERIYVWVIKTLQNRKVILGVIGLYCEYFEATYDSDRNKVYLDMYKKDKNIVAESVRIE